jgi:hypothetical protein
MLYLALGAVAVVFILFAGRGKKPILKRREWRFLTAMFALVAFAGAAYAGVRSAWGTTVVLTVVGLWLLTSSRRTGPAPAPASHPARMSEAEARSILGVGERAGPAEIKDAYTRLMRLAHPDKGGTSGLAAQLNAARERLLKD